MATDYQKVTSTADLVAGAKYVIGTDAGRFISTESYGNNRKITTATVTDGVVTATEAMMVFTLGGQADAWTFATDNYLGTAGYLNATNATGSNYLKVVADLDDYAYFTIAIADGVTTVTCNGKASRNILYLNGTTCFACYNTQSTSQYSKPNLYKEVSVAPLTTVKTVYCKNVQSWWYEDGAAVGVYAFADGEVKNAAWPGVRMEAVTGEEGLWKADIDTARYAQIIFTRVNATGDIADWGAKTANLTIPADKDLYTITSTTPVWGDPGVTGEWSVYGEEPPVENHTYTVAGSNADLFGTAWDPALEANDMVLQEDGTYKWEKADVTLSAGNIELKVVKDHAWGEDGVNAYPLGPNYILNIAEDGVYTVTIIFNPAAEENKISAEAVKTGGAEIEHTYTVAGEPATLFGSNWDATDTNNDMVLQEDGTYKWEKTEVTLPISTIAFKVVKDHSWDVAYPAQNYILNIAENGVYTVTIIFNPAAEENKISAEAVKTGSAEIDPTAVLGFGVWGGDEQDWSQADMVLSGDKSYATITKTLTAGDYRFKTVINGGWRSNAYVYHRGFPAAAGISGNEDPNMKLQADVDGDYIFNWFFANDSLEITFPAAVAPTAAPAAPTYEGYQVQAVYSATYNADCNFGEWNSGTQYAQEDYGKKFITNASGYFGLEFTGKDCSEMEALHLDVWAASDIAFRVVPIHGGAEVGVTVNIEGQKWNSINIPLSEFTGVTNWSNVYQIKIDNASNLTFWLNNVYFYTTQTKTVDLTDGYYLMGSMNSWDIHNFTADHLFIPNNDVELKLHYTLAEGDEFKVVSVANNALVAWYPEGENNNYVVDFAHAGEKDIYFRPDYQGGEDWHAGCIYVAADENANPWETWFATGDTWNAETESYLDWDAENGKATVHINVDKYGQWRAQVKYHGPVAEEGKCYRVALKMKSNNAISNVTIKYQDNVEMVYVNNIALAANTEYAFDQTAAGLPNGNGIMVLDFGFAHAGDIIEIYDVVIEEAECPQPEAPKYYLIGSMTNWSVIAQDAYLFAVNPDNDAEYKLTYTLAAGDEFKVVKVEGETTTWYPEGENNNYVVDAAHAGEKDIYFRPDGQGGEGWHYGVIYVAPNSSTAISNTAVDAKAEKILRNGMILIIKGDKTYNVMGQIVK